MIEKHYVVERDDYLHAGQVSSQVKQFLQSLSIKPDVIRKVCVACYEAEINQIIHAWGGTLTLTMEDDGNLTLVFQDPGPGIEDIEKAMTPGYSTATEKARSLGFGAGMGLDNMKRVADSFTITSSPKGTTLTLGFKVA